MDRASYEPAGIGVQAEAERKLIVEVIGRYGHDKLEIDHNDVKMIALLSAERAIAALDHSYWVRRRMAARALANKIREYVRSQSNVPKQ
jgi:hypothetical protein